MPEVAEKVAANLVTSENHAEFVSKKLGLEVVTSSPPVAEQKKDEKPAESKAAEEKPASHAENPDEEPDAEVKPIRKGNPKIEQRFSTLTKARKEAEARAEANAAEVVREREARQAAEAKAAELEAKLNPQKTDELGPEPQPSQFKDIAEYSKALKDWTAENTRREDEQKREEAEQTQYQQKILKEWNGRLEAVRKEVPDYDARLKQSTVMVSDQVRDAILESEVGPKILLHLADNPKEAEEIGKLTVGGALRRIGMLEAKLGGTASPSSKSDTKSGDGKSDSAPSGGTVVEISRAPAPINTLKGASAPADSPVDAQGVFHGTYAEWKAGRRKGTIK